MAVPYILLFNLKKKSLNVHNDSMRGGGAAG